MRLEFVRPSRSISGPVTDEEVEDFVVLTGPNGSGKSNLLAAINEQAMLVSGVASGQSRPGHIVRLLRLGELGVADSGDQVLGAHRNAWRAVAADVRRVVHELTGRPHLLTAGSDQLEEEVGKQLEMEDRLSVHAFRAMTETAGKRLIDFDEDDYRRYAPAMAGIRDAFALTISEVFLSYHGRLEANDQAQWRHDRGKASRWAPLSEAEFSARYGMPPWDLLNEVLETIGLDYRISPPASDDDSVPYELRLTHLVTNVAVQVNQLSSGEMTLLGLAMSLYSGLHLGKETWLPQVLLLDEPDASLHPSMIRSLLRVIEDIFVQRHGMKVMLATHSPTTVALAPEAALYTISRTGSPRLKRASRDEALRTLMVGLPTLSIRDENRIPVFVESEDDESCYQVFPAAQGPAQYPVLTRIHCLRA